MNRKWMSILLSVVMAVSLFAALPAPRALAGACTSKATGNWSSSGTWNLGCSGTDGIPISGDNVTISAENTVTVDDGSAVCNDLSFALGTAKLAFSSTGVLGVYGNMTIFSTASSNFGTWTSGGKLLFTGTADQSITNYSANVTFTKMEVNKSSGTVTLAQTDARFKFTDLILTAGTLSVGSGVGVEGAASSASITINGGIWNQTQGATKIHVGETGSSPIGTVTVNSGTMTLLSSSTSDFNMTTLTVQSGGIVEIQYGTAILNVTTSLSVDGTSTLKIGQLSAFTFPATVTLNGTVEFNRAGAQAIPAASYYNLVTSGSSAKTAGAALTINGSITIGSATTFVGLSYAHTVKGNWTNNGTFTTSGSSGTVTFNGGGTDQTISGSSATSFYNLTVSGKGDGVTTTNSVVVIPTTNIPTVAGTVINNGTLKQTKTVNASSTVDFLNLSTSKYYGVQIKAGGTALDSTTVAVSGNQTCSQANGNPVKRCFDVSPATQASADIKFYFANAELQGQTLGSINVWNFHTGTWNAVTRGGDSGTCGSGAINCYVQGNSISTYSLFTLKVDTPLAAPLAALAVTAVGGRIVVAWETTSELSSQGYYVYRAAAAGGDWTRLNAAMIASQAPGSPSGYGYRWNDAGVARGATYRYRVAAVGFNGREDALETVSVTTPVGWYWLPVVAR